MTTPVSLHAYRIASRLLPLLSGPILARRLRAGKEDPARVSERRGFASLPRPPGPLVWLHGASVGEAVSLLPFVERLTQAGATALVTTGTVTSADLLAQRLPPRAFHQYAPLDAPRYVRRFLAHWRPDATLIAESEIWPNAIIEATRGERPLAFVNARMSERSFARWRKAQRFAEALLGRVGLCLAQSQVDGERFAALGAPRVAVAGNVKYDAPAPPADRRELAELSGLASGRQIWIAASTHDGEERIAAEAHRRVAGVFPDLLTLIAPRHPERGPAVLAEMRAAGLSASLRSRGDRLGSDTAVYICDTIGELGLFYRLADVVFVGRSFGDGGGQNPIEPAKLASAILHGPAVANFADTYAMLDACGGAMEVSDVASLADALASLFGDTARLRGMARAAARAVEEQAGAVERSMQALAALLPVAVSAP